jgi:hypothetical protein
MQATDQQLGEVVVIGYGTQKKATLTGSVSTVSGVDVAKSPSPISPILYRAAFPD